MGHIFRIHGQMVNVESIDDLSGYLTEDLKEAIDYLIKQADEEAEHKLDEEMDNLREQDSDALQEVRADIEDLEKRIAKTKTIRTTTLEDYLMKMRDHINPYI